MNPHEESTDMFTVKYHCQENRISAYTIKDPNSSSHLLCAGLTITLDNYDFALTRSCYPRHVRIRFANNARNDNQRCEIKIDIQGSVLFNQKGACDLKAQIKLSTMHRGVVET